MPASRSSSEDEDTEGHCHAWQGPLLPRTRTPRATGSPRQHRVDRRRRRHRGPRHPREDLTVRWARGIVPGLSAVRSRPLPVGAPDASGSAAAPPRPAAPRTAGLGEGLEERLPVDPQQATGGPRGHRRGPRHPLQQPDLAEVAARTHVLQRDLGPARDAPSPRTPRTRSRRTRRRRRPDGPARLPPARPRTPRPRPAGPGPLRPPTRTGRTERAGPPSAPARSGVRRPPGPSAAARGRRAGRARVRRAPRSTARRRARVR